MVYLWGDGRALAHAFVARPGDRGRRATS